MAALPRQPLTRPLAHAHAGQLLRDLTPHVGDQQAVREVMLRYLDEHDVADLGAICMAVTYVTFVECLTLSPTVPPGSVTYELDGDEPDGTD